MSDRLITLSDHIRPKESDSVSNKLWLPNPTRIASKVEFFNEETGELLYEPLHNKTLIAGAALTAMKLFNFDAHCLSYTPTYNEELQLEGYSDNSAITDEKERIIWGFCVGQGGAGLDISDVYDVPYCSWIDKDQIIPFRYPTTSRDDVDQATYKGKSVGFKDGGKTAYFFKTFANTPYLQQSYVSTAGTFSDNITANKVYTNTASSDMAQTTVELHLKITKTDCREYFSAFKQTPKINQISLVAGWPKTVTSGGKTVVRYNEIRPFSLLHIPNEIINDTEKSISCIYTLYF